MLFNTVVLIEVDIRVACIIGKGFLLLFEHFDKVLVVFVIIVDLVVVVSMDKDLDRIGLVIGGFVYLLVWNVFFVV